MGFEMVGNDSVGVGRDEWSHDEYRQMFSDYDDAISLLAMALVRATRSVDGARALITEAVDIRQWAIKSENQARPDPMSRHKEVLAEVDHGLEGVDEFIAEGLAAWLGS